MRSAAMAGGVLALIVAGNGPARALEESASDRSLFWRVVFSSLEAEKATAFLSVGSKLGMSNPTGDVSFFIAGSQGTSLSDADRSRRFGWTGNSVESQSRLMAGFERSQGNVFVSLAVGGSQARMQAARQPDPLQRLIRIAAGYGIETQHLPALVAALPPATVQGLLPPRMETNLGAVLDLNLWWRPHAATYAHWSIVGDSAAQSLWTRLRLGVKPGALPFAAGPEVAAAVGRNWHKFKIGLHLGDMKLWRMGLELAGGWMLDETRRPGPYATFALHIRF